MTTTTAPVQYDSREVKARFTLDSLAEYAAQQTDTTSKVISSTKRRLEGGNLGGLEIEEKDNGALVWFHHAAGTGGDTIGLFGYLEFGNPKPKGEAFVRALELAGDYINALTSKRANSHATPRPAGNGKGHVKPAVKQAPKLATVRRSDERSTLYPFTKDGVTLAYEERIDFIAHKEDGTSHPDKEFRPYPAGGKFGDGLTHLPPMIFEPEWIELGTMRKKMIYLVEGATCATAMNERGEYCATTIPGFQTWTEEHSKLLAGADCIVLPDNDNTGENKAARILETLPLHARSVRVLRLPNLPPKGDIVNYFEQGGTDEELALLSEDAPLCHPPDYVDVAAELAALDADVFTPTWDNQPPETKPSLTLNGTRIGSIGNSTVFVGGGGAGKSAVGESICARAIDPQCDALGFDVQVSGPILYIDSERSQEDTHTSWRRLVGRARLTRGDARDGQIHWKNFKTVPTVADKRKKLDRYIELLRPGMVILDGIGDFISDVNDAEEVGAYFMYLQAQAELLRFSLVMTIHPNPKTDKARGHLGTEAWRRCESYLNIFFDKKSEISTITSKGEMGKIRSGAPVEAHFRWDTEAHMHVTSDPPAAGNGKPAARENALALVAKIYATRTSYSYSDLLSAIEEATGKSRDTAKYHYGKMKSESLIVQSPIDKTWMCNPDEVSNDDPF